MINSVIVCRRKIEPLGTLVCYQQECLSTVQRSESEGVNGQCDMIHQDAGNFKQDPLYHYSWELYHDYRATQRK